MSECVVRSWRPGRVLRFAVVQFMATSIVLTGCYRSVPIDGVQPNSGTRVVVNLTQQGSSQMAASIGPAAQEVEGVVRNARADSLELSVIRILHSNEREVYWNREPVTFPVGTFATVEQRQLDKRRTALFSAGLLIAAFFVGRAFTSGSASGSGGGGPPVEPPQ